MPEIGDIPSYIARCAQLAMLLEVSSSPKPGNIDRHNDYEDTRYEHFLSSAVSVYPVFSRAAEHGLPSLSSSAKSSVGELIHRATIESNSWQKGGNTHFGAFILLIPLCIASAKVLASGHSFSMASIIQEASAVVKATTSDDAVEFYRCFEKAGVKVNDVSEFDLNSSDSQIKLKEQNITLYDLMEISQSYDQIAGEWVNGFLSCAECARFIIEGLGSDSAPYFLVSDLSASNLSRPGIFGKKDSCIMEKDINNVIVYSFLKILSTYPDTFIQTKRGRDMAVSVCSKAKKMVGSIEASGSFSDNIEQIQRFDDELLDDGINPGSTADIVIAGLFLALLGGVRF